jgi:hypothetical protein
MDSISPVIMEVTMLKVAIKVLNTFLKYVNLSHYKTMSCGKPSASTVSSICNKNTYTRQQITFTWFHLFSIIKSNFLVKLDLYKGMSLMAHIYYNLLLNVRNKEATASRKPFFTTVPSSNSFLEKILYLQQHISAEDLKRPL